MAVPEPTLPQLRAAAIAGATIAILATSFRLYIRAKRHSFWWDDAWAFMSMVAIVIMLTGMLIFTSPPDAHPYRTKIAAYYMFDNGFYGVIWCARISMVLTIVRMAYGRFQTFLKWCVAGILVTWAVLFAQVFWTCESEPGWKDQPTPQCMLGRDVAVAQIVTDCIVDLLLIICPTYLLSSMKQRKGLKLRLMAIFSSTIFVTIFSLVHSYMILKDLGKMEFMFAVVEDVVSLIVVNLTVIATWLFKLADDDSSREHSGPSAHMNTFLKGRLSKSGGRDRSAANHDMTTMVVLTQIETNVVADRDKGDGTITVLPALSEYDREHESTDVESLSTVGKGKGV